MAFFLAHPRKSAMVFDCSGTVDWGWLVEENDGVGAQREGICAVNSLQEEEEGGRSGGP